MPSSVTQLVSPIATVSVPDVTRVAAPESPQASAIHSQAIDCLGTVATFEAGESPPAAASVAQAKSFFHTEGRDIVDDGTGLIMTFRGVNLPNLEFGVFEYAFGNGPQVDSRTGYPGTLDTDYFEPRSVDFQAIAARGFNAVRVPFEWSRLVVGWTPGSQIALDATYLGMLDRIVDGASKNSLYVIPEMHDFFVYRSGRASQVYVNGSQPHQAMLAGTWQLLAAHYANNTSVAGYDLMNEPYYPSGQTNHWPETAQAVVNAVREVDKRHLIFVEGTDYSRASSWAFENGDLAIVDTVSPPRLVYEVHAYMDANNDSTYDESERTVPAPWVEYYVRDRLMPPISWSIEKDVPILVGEIGVPPTVAWAGVMDAAFRSFFEPLHISVLAWHYTNPAHNPDDPLNLARSPEGEVLLDTLDNFPGGLSTDTPAFRPVPDDSLLYDEYRVNPWGDPQLDPRVSINDSATPPAATGYDAGQHVISVGFSGTWGNLKFLHDFGLDTTVFDKLHFYIFPTSGDLDFRIYTNGSKPQTAVFPAEYEQRHALSDYVSGPLIANQWQLVEIPFKDIVSPNDSVITGIAFQDDNRKDAVFFLDQVRLTPVPLSPLTVTINQAVSQADPVTTGPIHFRVVFSKPVADFGAGDLAIGGTAAGNLVATVTPVGLEGTTYDVAVSGMTANGTVVASVVPASAHDAMGNANRPFTSSDNRVLYATWHNSANPCDVNNQDGVTPIDVLLIINYLNSNPGSGSLPAPPAVPPPFYDVNGDGYCSPLDALVVINCINGVSQGAAEAEMDTVVALPQINAARLSDGGVDRELPDRNSSRLASECTDRLWSEELDDLLVPSTASCDTSDGGSSSVCQSTRIDSESSVLASDEDLFEELLQEIARDIGRFS